MEDNLELLREAENKLIQATQVAMADGPYAAIDLSFLRPILAQLLQAVVAALLASLQKNVQTTTQD
jgi:hypothetical protein